MEPERIPRLTEEERIRMELERIPLLTKDNYGDWKKKMVQFLRSERLLGINDEEIVPPPAPCLPDDNQSLIVLNYIQKRCGTRARNFIRGLRSGADAWKQLAIMYGTQPFDAAGQNSSTNYTWCLPLYRAIVDGKWEKAKPILERNNGALTARLTSEAQTPLHIAVQKGNATVVEKLLNMLPEMPPESLSTRDKYGRTPLHIAASGENKKIVELLVAKSNDPLLMVVDTGFPDDNIPVNIAVRASKKDIVHFLYRKTMQKFATEADHHGANINDPYEGIKAGLLTSLIFGDFYDLALHLLRKYRYLFKTKDLSGKMALQALSQKPSAFRSSFTTIDGFGILGSLIYQCIKVKTPSGLVVPVAPAASASATASASPTAPTMSGTPAALAMQGPLAMPIALGLSVAPTACMDWLARRLGCQTSNPQPCDMHNTQRRDIENPISGCFRYQTEVPGIENLETIYHKKVTHVTAKRLLEGLWNLIVEHGDDFEEDKELISVIFKATQFGIVEFIDAVIMNCPQLMWCVDEKTRRSIFHSAIFYRQEKIFYRIREVALMKFQLIETADRSKNYMLHLAAYLSPPKKLNLFPGPALKMHHEVRWYKEVQSIVPSTHEDYINKKGKTPIVLFREQHGKLLAEAKSWMKATATQCMVVTTLIATIMFAAAFTVPGVDGSKISNIFVASEVLALSSSVASLLIFLIIIISCHAEEDFLKSLPQKLSWALLLLLISVVCMMIAFVDAIWVFFHHDTWWIPLLIVLLATIPVIVKLLLEFRLYGQMILPSWIKIYLE